MSGDKVFVDGMIVKRSEKAPDYVLCNLSIKVDELYAWCREHENKGWVNVQCLVSKAGKPYACLDTWEPNRQQVHDDGMAQAKQAAAPEPDFEDSDIPF